MVTAYNLNEFVISVQLSPSPLSSLPQPYCYTYRAEVPIVQHHNMAL
jgi:hypothetical protein